MTSRSIKGIILLAVTVTLLYFIWYLLVGRSFVPDDFTAARRQSALVAKDIVALTEKSLENLDLISLQDRNYNFKKALELVREELERAKESRLKAIELTMELDKTVRSAQEIKPSKARNLVIEAAGHEVSLISHLIVYNDILNGLLQTLEFKFSGDIGSAAEDVQNLIKSMNQEAKEINELDKLFNIKMRQFDELVG